MRGAARTHRCGGGADRRATSAAVGNSGSTHTPRLTHRVNRSKHQRRRKADGPTPHVSRPCARTGTGTALSTAVLSGTPDMSQRPARATERAFGAHGTPLHLPIVIGCSGRGVRVTSIRRRASERARERPRCGTRQTDAVNLTLYLSFFFGRSWLLWPQIFLRQLTARGGKRA